MDHLINFVTAELHVYLLLTNGPGIIIIHEFFCVLEQFQFPSNLIHSGFSTTKTAWKRNRHQQACAPVFDVRKLFIYTY
jgi:hypothetical protein